MKRRRLVATSGIDIGTAIKEEFDALMVAS